MDVLNQAFDRRQTRPLCRPEEAPRERVTVAARTSSPPELCAAGVKGGRIGGRTQKLQRAGESAGRAQYR